ncbi:MAG TPA: YpdA family putative bacillithiol disulfide reductase [Bacteroidota bacterium]|nr:YpdA family putative bacillithiol disulfide reductase [Bacteroidota bacterium]
MNSTYDLIIIGAGPSGLSCAIEAKHAGLNYLVIDKGGIADGIQKFQRDMFFFSTPELLEIGGVPFVVPTTRPTSLDCVNYYRSIVEYFDLQCAFYDPIERIVSQDGMFTVKSSNGAERSAKAVVIATGYYDTPTPLGVPGEDLPHVTHFYRDPLPFFNQHVLIVGGKNSAVEAALDLWRHGAFVTVVHRGEALSSGVKYWILPDFQNRVADGSITLQLNSKVKEFRRGCTIVEEKGGSTKEFKTDFAFILVGYLPDVGFLRSSGIDINPGTLAPAHNPETMETNIPNLFVCGGLVGGRFNNKVFIENGREHGKKIVAALRRGL